MRSDHAVTLHDVASKAGVSKSLVSLVMNDSPKVAPATRQRVLDAASQLGYRPNLMARQLAKHRTDALGVFLPDLHNPLFASILDGVNEAATEDGHDLVLVSSYGRSDRERAAAQTALDHRVAGLLIISPSMPADDVQALASTVPVVVTSRAISGVDAVSVDEHAGARLAVEHLVSLGHRRIAHVSGLTGLSEARRDAYQQVMTANGLGDQIVIESGGYSEVGGEAAARRLLARADPPTGVFAANDLSALGVLRALRERGLRVPTDVSVVGFDNTTLARSSYVSLSTVDQPGEDIGRYAVRMLRERITDNHRAAREVLLAPALHARATSAPPGLEESDL